MHNTPNVAVLLLLAAGGCATNVLAPAPLPFGRVGDQSRPRCPNCQCDIPDGRAMAWIQGDEECSRHPLCEGCHRKLCSRGERACPCCKKVAMPPQLLDTTTRQRAMRRYLNTRATGIAAGLFSVAYCGQIFCGPKENFWPRLLQFQTVGELLAAGDTCAQLQTAAWLRFSDSEEARYQAHRIATHGLSKCDDNIEYAVGIPDPNLQEGLVGPLTKLARWLQAHYVAHRRNPLTRKCALLMNIWHVVVHRQYSPDMAMATEVGDPRFWPTLAIATAFCDCTTAPDWAEDRAESTSV